MTRRLSPLSLAALGGAMLVAALPAGASPQRQVREIRCDLLEQDRGRLITVEANDLHVLRQTEGGRRFQPAIPEGTAGISCGRTHIVPAAWDDQVILLGVPLFIAELGSANRFGVLEIDNGRFRFRFISGEARPEEQAMIDERIETFQARFDAAQRRRAGQ